MLDRRTAAIAIAAVALARSAQAQHAGSRGGHGAPRPAANEPAATREFREANARMHRAMDIRFTGQPDRDLVGGMIPHHEGAIDMARIVLRHGSGPEVRRLAEAIIREQEREIAPMRATLARLPGPR